MLSALMARAVEYADCTHISILLDDTKPSYGEVPVLEPWGNVEYSFIVFTPGSTLSQSGCTC